MNKPLASNRENTQKAAGRVVSGADRLPSIILRDLPGVADIEAVLSTPGAAARPENANLQSRIDAISVACFGVTEADCRIPRPTFLSVNGCNADYTVAEQQLFSREDEEWCDFEQAFDILDARRFPAKERFEALKLYGMDVLNDKGKPLRCWGYFGRQMVAAIEELFEESKFDPSAKPVSLTPSEDQLEALAVSLQREAERFKPSR